MSTAALRETFGAAGASVKLVVLNERDSRFDYFFYHGTFNQALPADMSVALRQISGCIGALCQYNLISYRTGRSNTVDNMLEVTEKARQSPRKRERVERRLPSVA